MKMEKLNKDYSLSELADSFVFKTKLTKKQQESDASKLSEARKKVQSEMTDAQKLYAKVLQLRFLMEDYAKSNSYNEDLSFAYFLRKYIKLNYKVNKDFANDIQLDETELSLILNKHRPPNEKIIVRLELHSNNTIPALSWLKLLDKEKEHRLQTDKKIRSEEEKYVQNRLVFDF